MISHFLPIFVLTIVAGLTTAIGGVLGFFVKKTSPKFLAFLVGVSAGTMIFLSLAELFPEAQEELAESFGDVPAKIAALAALLFGAIATAFFEKLVPAPKGEKCGCEICNFQNLVAPKAASGKAFSNFRFVGNAENSKNLEQLGNAENLGAMKRSGIFFALAIVVHNLPEGFAMFVAGNEEFARGALIAFAVALHNIPLGLTISIPFVYSSDSRKKAFFVPLLVGLAEPVGAIFAAILLIFLPGISANFLGILDAVIAGVMVFIVFSELLPMIERLGEKKFSLLGVAAGTLLIGITCCFL